MPSTFVLVINASRISARIDKLSKRILRPASYETHMSKIIPKVRNTCSFHDAYSDLFKSSFIMHSRSTSRFFVLNLSKVI